jgi:integrase
MTDAKQDPGVSPATTERRDFGTIIRRKDSRFLWVRYWAGGEKPHEESSHSTSVKVAEKLLARRQAELGLGVFTAPSMLRKKFEKVVELLHEDYRDNARRSTARLDFSLAHLTRAFAGVRLAAIDTDRLAAYKREREAAGAAPATIRLELGTLKHGLRLALGRKQLASVPSFPKLAPSKSRQGFFEPAEVDALMAELPDYLRPVVQFLYLTGWRKMEALNLTWDRVDFEQGEVRLEKGTTKNGEARVFPFAVLPELKALLEHQRDVARETSRRTGAIVTHVFHREGKRLRRDFYYPWHNACAAAASTKKGALAIVRFPQLADRIPHDFRRTACRNLIRAGVPEHVAMELTGHKTREIFRRYDIVDQRDLAAAVEKLAAYHAQQRTAAAQ